MPTIRLSPNAETFWIATGEALVIPDSVIGSPALVNENDTGTGFQVNQADFVFGIAGSEVLSIGATALSVPTGYEAGVTADEHVPNKKYVDDLATNYAAAGHNHDADYAVIAHHHDAAYAPLVHNHNADYAAIGHNHNADYAPLVHNHDADYVALTGDQSVAGTKTHSAPIVFTPVLIANLPTGVQGMLAYVSDDVGGPTPVHYDGTNWRRVYDNAIASTV